MNEKMTDKQKEYIKSLIEKNNAKMLTALDKEFYRRAIANGALNTKQASKMIDFLNQYHRQAVVDVLISKTVKPFYFGRKAATFLKEAERQMKIGVHKTQESIVEAVLQEESALYNEYE